MRLGEKKILLNIVRSLQSQAENLPESFLSPSEPEKEENLGLNQQVKINRQDRKGDH